MKNRPTAFWSLNGKLDEDEIERQVIDMHTHGMGGFVLHARLGLETDYMGPEWFAAVKKAVETASRLGMIVWLYDEYHCPSGTSYGEVYREGGDDFILRALSARRDDMGQIQYSTLVTNKATVKEEIPHTDVMNPAAVQAFIEKAYEPYKKELCAHFGKTIQGVFTDEPSIDVFNDFEGSGGLVPWTDNFPGYFERKRGYDITDCLPLLFLEEEGSFKVRHDYWRTISELFSETFSGSIGKWCEREDLKFTGHYLCEKSFGYAVSHGGAIMPHYRFQHTPALDILCEQIEEHLTVKQCTSVANQYGREQVMSESYGCSGWQLTFEGMKWVGDWQYVMGVNLLSLHLYMYSIKGFRKLDHPPFFGESACWWKFHKVVQDYFGRVGTVTSHGKPVRKILVIHPLSTAWGIVGGTIERSTMFDNPSIQNANDLGEQFNRFVRTLMGFHFDFDLGDEIIIEEAGRAEDGRFRVKDAVYDMVIIPPAKTLFSQTVDLLETYLEAGGIVVAVRPMPDMIDGSKSDQLGRVLHHDNTRVVEDAHEACSCIENALPRTLSIENEYGAEDGDILAMERRAEGIRTYFLINTDRKRAHKLSITFGAAGKVERWNPVSGEITDVPVIKRETSVLFEESIGPAGSRIYVMKADEAPVVVSSFPVEERSMYAYQDIHAVLGPECRFTRTAPNALVLDMCRYKLSDGEWSGDKEARKADIKIRDKLGIKQNVGYGISLESNSKFEKDGPALSLEYRFRVEEMPDAEMMLVVEEANQFEISLNGIAQHCEPTGYFLDRSFVKLPLHGVRTGENTLSMSCRYKDSLEIDSCYIIGDFAVSNGRSIMAEPKTIRTGDWCLQGYPYYSGSIIYAFEVDIETQVKAYARLEVGNFEGACANVTVNGSDAGMVPWQDADGINIAGLLKKGKNRIDIEVMGTPRNLFGPLHLTQTNRLWTAEPSFLSSGPSHTDEYVLHPYGLMSQVNIYKDEFTFK